MKTTQKLLLITAVASLLPLQALAQSLTDTITIEGRLTSLSNSFQGPTELGPEASFVAILEVDRQAVLETDLPDFRHYEEAVLSAAIELYDSQGQPIETPITTRCDDTTIVSEAPTSSAEIYLTEGDAESAAYLIQGGDFNGRLLACVPELAELVAPLFPESVGFPIPLAGDYEADFDMTIQNGDSMRGISVEVAGVAERITVETIDSDGDGIDDFSDMCPASLTSETVTFEGGYDSGVTNHVDASGCTIMDHYAVCEVEEAEQPTSPWGWFQPLYSGPSYCEKQVSYELVADGVISYSEARMLRDGLYQSHQSGGAL